VAPFFKRISGSVDYSTEGATFQLSTKNSITSYKDKEIADELYISVKTVKKNRVNLMRKLNLYNISSLINYALEKGLISIYEILESRFSKRKLEAN
jgi:hypothetical protein